MVNDFTIKLKEKIESKEDEVLSMEMAEHSVGGNTKSVRDKIIKMAHYYHLLQIMGDETVDRTKADTYYALARDKVQKAKDGETRRKEIAETCLIDQHTRAWELVEYYYEKASKILCQMMVTVMDYILQEKSGISVLYKDGDRANYFDLLDEITYLNDDYIVCYAFLCAYDYCTERIATFTTIDEYRHLTKEHERIQENGMPGRVSETIMTLKEFAGADKRDYFVDIEKAYTSVPEYNEEMLEKCFEIAVGGYSDDVTAMMAFSNVVVKVDRYYEDYMMTK